jgi:hypothetical protein
LIASASPVSASVHRGVGHHRRALRDAGQHRLARGIEITDDLNTEPVLLQRHHSRLQRVRIGQRGEAVRGGSRADGFTL